MIVILATSQNWKKKTLVGDVKIQTNQLAGGRKEDAN
jgi:hypothetical protein